MSFQSLHAQREARHLRRTISRSHAPHQEGQGASAEAHVPPPPAQAVSAKSQPLAPVSVKSQPSLSPGALEEEVSNLSLDASPSKPSQFSKPTQPSPSPSFPAAAANALFPELADTALEIRTTAEHGRGLYATKSVVAGTSSLSSSSSLVLSSSLPTSSSLTTGSTLLHTSPLTAILSAPHLETHCATCHRETAVKRCAACKALHYCSPACQRADWGAHKPECAALSRLRRMWAATYPDRAARGENGFVPHEAVRALARMCWARKAARLAGRGVDARWWGQVAGMESHASDGGLRLGNQVQHLRHYLGAATGTGELLEPADMAEFGFVGARELLDMASAVSPPLRLTGADCAHASSRSTHSRCRRRT